MRLYSSDCEYGRHDPPIGLLLASSTPRIATWNLDSVDPVDTAHVRAGIHASPMWAG
jgi:hypothetical protein